MPRRAKPLVSKSKAKAKARAKSSKSLSTSKAIVNITMPTRTRVARAVAAKPGVPPAPPGPPGPPDTRGMPLPIRFVPMGAPLVIPPVAPVAPVVPVAKTEEKKEEKKDPFEGLNLVPRLEKLDILYNMLTDKKEYDIGYSIPAKKRATKKVYGSITPSAPFDFRSTSSLNPFAAPNTPLIFNRVPDSPDPLPAPPVEIDEQKEPLEGPRPRDVDRILGANITNTDGKRMAAYRSLYNNGELRFFDEATGMTMPQGATKLPAAIIKQYRKLNTP